MGRLSNTAQFHYKDVIGQPLKVGDKVLIVGKVGNLVGQKIVRIDAKGVHVDNLHAPKKALGHWVNHNNIVSLAVIGNHL